MAAGDDQALLRLLHLADSVLPVGALAHSYGIETLTAEGMLAVEGLETFLQPYMQEVGGLEAIACRLACRLSATGAAPTLAREWRDLNQHLSALKMARESRAASTALGRRLFQLARDLDAQPAIVAALAAMRDASVEAHYCAAFGLVAASMGIAEDDAVLGYLRQMLGNVISCCQRLLPLGQSLAGQMLWRLYPSLAAVADRSKRDELSLADMAQFTPTLDVASMRHPRLPTRLFIS